MTETGLLQAVILLGVLVFLGAVLIRATAHDLGFAQLEVQVFLAAIGLRFAGSLALYEYGLIGVIQDEDASAWSVGVAVYQDWVRRGVSLLELPYECTDLFIHPLGNLGYPYLVGAIFHLTDMPGRLPAAVLDNFCGAATCVVASRIASVLFSRWVAVRVGWWTCLMPSLVIWSSQTLKEPVVILLETIALYSCIRLKTERFSAWHVGLCALSIFLLVPFRFYAAYITAAVVVVSLLMPRFTAARTSTISGIAVGALLIALVVNTGLLASQIVVVEKFDLKTLQDIRDHAARHTGSGVPLDYDLRTVSGFAMSAVVGGAHVLFAPFPWQMQGTLRLGLTVPDVVVWWWLAFQGLIPGFVYCVRRRFDEIQPLLLFTLALGLLYGIIFSNVGLAYRYRAQLMPFLLIVAMVGLEQRRLRQLEAGRVAAARWAALRTGRGLPTSG